MNKISIKILLVMLAMSCLCLARQPLQIHALDPAQKAGNLNKEIIRGAFIAEGANVRSILGPQGKNIAVSANGEAVAVIYGAPTMDPYGS
ncbi:MAG: hypothetical protein JSW02_04945, partial [candidate division WOR-3 bacterium]